VEKDIKRKTAHTRSRPPPGWKKSAMTDSAQYVSLEGQEKEGKKEKKKTPGPF
jgi:hypothetical protein